MDYPTTREEALALFASTEPIILNNAIPQKELENWNLKNLQKLCEFNESFGKSKVSVHHSKTSDGKISFVDKTFNFQVLEMQKLIENISNESNDQYFYLRSIGENPRKDRAHFWRDYKPIAQHTNFLYPSKLIDFEDEYFSSVFRIASKGLQLWTHYDVMQNILYQCYGSKRVVLFKPDSADALDFHGSSSSIIDIEVEDKISKGLLDESCPFVKARRNAFEIELKSGQALYIPALWPHNVKAETACISVNIFFKELSSTHYGGKDLYGNRDPLLAEQALKLVEKAKDILQSAQDDGTSLPQSYIEFYTRLASAKLKN